MVLGPLRVRVRADASVTMAVEPKGQQMNTLPAKLRVYSVVTLVSASLICTLFAKLTRDDCATRSTQSWILCASAKNPDGSYKHSEAYCAAHANAVWNHCMILVLDINPNNGHIPPPPPLPTGIRLPTPVGVAQPPPSKSPPPLSGKPIIHPPVTGPINYQESIAIADSNPLRKAEVDPSAARRSPPPLNHRRGTCFI
jgi:hypothetical protein